MYRLTNKRWLQEERDLFYSNAREADLGRVYHLFTIDGSSFRFDTDLDTFWISGLPNAPEVANLVTTRVKKLWEAPYTEPS